MSDAQARALAYRRTHSLLLIQRLLSFASGVSPLTVILDSLEQSARPVIYECIARAKRNKVLVVFLGFETYKSPAGVDTFIKAHRKSASTLQQEITSAIGSSKTSLLVIDTIHPLIPLSTSFPSLLTTLAPPGTSLLLVYHADCPLPSSITSSFLSENPYAPSPLTLITHLATTLITPTPLSHAFAAHTAAQRALAPPALHGRDEGHDGVLVSLGANGGGARLDDAPLGFGRGIVLDVEHRRRSGRGVRERVFLTTEDAAGREIHWDDDHDGGGNASMSTPTAKPRSLTLLDEHPCFAAPPIHSPAAHGDAAATGDDTPEAAAGTFSLALTDRQRRERAGVVLPYYDAQKEGAEGSAGAGGRILYQMGVEDAGDWDSEEDEL